MDLLFYHSLSFGFYLDWKYFVFWGYRSVDLASPNFSCHLVYCF